jgi:hypothetical protein
VFTPEYGIWCVNKTFIKLLDQSGSENLGYNLSGNLSVTYFGLPKKFRCPSYPQKKASVAQHIQTEAILRTSYAPNMTDSMLSDSDVMFEEIWDKGVLVDNIKRPAGKLLFTDAKDPAVAYTSHSLYQGNYVNHWDEHGEIVEWEMHHRRTRC